MFCSRRANWDDVGGVGMGWVGIQGCFLLGFFLSESSGMEVAKMRCGRCGYPLVGMAREGKCPECGEVSANAVEVAGFVAEQGRMKRVGVGVWMVVVAFVMEMVWAVVFVGILVWENFLFTAQRGTPWVPWEESVLLVNAAVLVLVPSMTLAGGYLILCGARRGDMGGRGAWRRVVLMVLLVVYFVSTASAWGALVLPTSHVPYELGYMLSAVIRMPVVMVLIMGLGMGLMLSAVGEVQARLNIRPRVWARRGAYVALGVVVMLALGAHGFEWYVKGLSQSSIHPMGVSFGGPGPPAIAPGWSFWGKQVNGPGYGSRMPIFSEAVEVRCANIRAVCMSDCGAHGLLRWVNVGTWWGIRLFAETNVYWSDARYPQTAWMLSVGLVKVGVGMRTNHFIAGGMPGFVLWPELVWGVLGLLASGYLWVYVVVQGVRVIGVLRVIKRDAAG